MAIHGVCWRALGVLALVLAPCVAGAQTVDTTPPQVSIIHPAPNGSTVNVGTCANSFVVTGTASDDTGVTRITWSNDRGGGGVANGTASWTVSYGLVLGGGTNVITITAFDAAGNSGRADVTLTCQPPDFPPSVSITSPGSGGQTLNACFDSVALAGTAYDESGITQVSWSNDRGGSGVADGTSSWSIAALPLMPGTNHIAVRAVDGGGQVTDASLTFEYHVPSPTGNADVFWQHGSDINAVWHFTGPSPSQVEYSYPIGVAGSWDAQSFADVNCDRVKDVVWFWPPTGEAAISLMTSTAAVSKVTYQLLNASILPGSPWSLAGVGDVNGDGRADLIWRSGSTGQVRGWLMDDKGAVGALKEYGVVPLAFQLAGVGDVNGDGIADLIWFGPSDGQVTVWLMNRDGSYSASFVGAVGPGSWRPYRIADFDGDGNADIAWRNEANGMTAVWYLSGSAISDVDFLVSVPIADWQLGTAADFDSDGRADLMWYGPTTGGVVRWMMKGRHISPTVEQLQSVGPGWHMVP